MTYEKIGTKAKSRAAFVAIFPYVNLHKDEKTCPSLAHEIIGLGAARDSIVLDHIREMG